MQGRKVLTKAYFKLICILGGKRYTRADSEQGILGRVTNAYVY